MVFSRRFTLPQGAVARVSILDSTTKLINLPATSLVTPSIPGFDVVPDNPSWCFLIESSAGRRAIFDLGVPPNWREVFPPAIVDIVRRVGFNSEADRHVADILQEHGVEPSSISSVVWR